MLDLRSRQVNIQNYRIIVLMSHSLGEPTKVKIVKKIYSGIYIHSHPFGGVEEAGFWSN